MKSSFNVLEGLKLLPHCSKDSVQQLGAQLGLSRATVDTYISRYLKRKQLHKLKNGLYVTADFFEKNRDDVSYAFYLANVIRAPSYVSSWSALQYYDLTTDVIQTVTSVTLKVTKNYQIKAGTFSYQSMNKELFNNFSLVRGKFDFFMASPAKALFDLLYYRTYQFRSASLANVMHLIQELRIDFDELENADQKKFHAMISPYLHE